MKIIYMHYVKETNIREILAAMNTAELVVEIGPKKISGPGFEPMTSEIPVQCSTNWANKPTGIRSFKNNCKF